MSGMTAPELDAYLTELDERLPEDFGPADIFWPRTVIYFSGAHNHHTAEARRDNLGLLLQPGNGYVSQIGAYPWVAADNGCFTNKTFNERTWFEWVQKIPVDRCLFVSAPDVVGDAEATWARSAAWLPMIRRAGHLAALVAQDGMEDMDNLEEQFRACDVLFIGGSTEWKLSEAARELTAKARAFGLWVHMGRVNSWKRMAIAQDFRCDSADGTFLAYGPDKNWPQLEGWLDRLREEPDEDWTMGQWLFEAWAVTTAPEVTFEPAGVTTFAVQAAGQTIGHVSVLGDGWRADTPERRIGRWYPTRDEAARAIVNVVTAGAAGKAA